MTTRKQAKHHNSLSGDLELQNTNLVASTLTIRMMKKGIIIAEHIEYTGVYGSATRYMFFILLQILLIFKLNL